MNTKELTKTYSMIFSLAALHLTKQKSNKPSEISEQIAFECIKLLKNPLTPSLKEIITVKRQFEKRVKALKNLKLFNIATNNMTHTPRQEINL
jgi:hypothetical protein